MKFDYTKEFEFFRDEEILKKLYENKYGWNYGWFSTDIPRDKPSFITPSEEFEEKLERDNIYNFAYIKFFEFNEKIFGIVGGLSKSKKVKGHSDVNFTKNLKHAPKTKWSAKEFLVVNNLEWHKEKILIVKPNHVANDDENRSEAALIEKYLQEEFHLFGS